MTQIRHLQQVILGIIKDIDELCTTHGIEYYLLGGSTIGAIRHQGFIPWDDDLDISMTDANYHKFLAVARESLDKEKYYLQEGLKDWALDFSKVRLRGTYIKEEETSVNPENENGIFVDIFRLDNAPNNRIAQIWQYTCAKYCTAYTLSVRSYKTASFSKRLIMSLTFPMKCKPIRDFMFHQVDKYNHKDTNYLAFYFGRTRLHSSIIRKDVYGTPTRVKFENLMLPVPENYDAYLTQMFGNYMQLPPVEQRTPGHILEIDFGQY